VLVGSSLELNLGSAPVPTMIGKGEKENLDESDKVLLKALFWVYNTTFLLPISAIGLISSDKPLLLLET
jgi:hypothetical protein